MEKAPTKAVPSLLTASAPEAVWSEVVALQEVAVKQLRSLEPPMGPEAPIFAEPLGQTDLSWKNSCQSCRLPLIESLPIVCLTSCYTYMPSSRVCFLKSVASYDDSEDRALTSYSIIRWKSVYVSSAIVYTEAPEDFRGFYKATEEMEEGPYTGKSICWHFFVAKK